MGELGRAGILVVCAAILATAVNGAVYHVHNTHPGASDANPGSAEAPWLTIQHAADTLEAGDTVLIHGGVYNESVSIDGSGNASDGHVMYSGHSGEVPVVDGSGDVGNNGMVITADYIRLQDIEIRNWGENALWAAGAGYLEVTGCTAHDVTYGFGLSDGTHHFTFTRVTAHHFDLYGFDASPGNADCHSGTFVQCVSHTGRDPEQNVDGFALGHGTQHTFLMDRCVTYCVIDGFDISSRDTTLQSCSASNCGNGGYKIWQDSVTLVNCLSYHNGISNVELDWDGDPGAVTLQNCTFMDSGTFNVWVEDSRDSLTMINCILAGGDNIGLAFETLGTENYHGDYNIFHNDNPSRAIVVGYEDEYSMTDLDAGAWSTATGQDAYSFTAASPADIFLDPGVFDLHLFETSVAVDRGTADGAPDSDYDGRHRPQGLGYDIGAYEYGDVPEQTGVEIFMPAQVFSPGDTCSCSVTVTNREGTQLTGYPLFAILDVYGSYFFAPEFNAFDWYDMTFPEGETVVPVIPGFSWPSGAGTASGIIWYAALTDPAMTALFGAMDTFTFGWQDESRVSDIRIHPQIGNGLSEK